jgi:hypothetical protein
MLQSMRSSEADRVSPVVAAHRSKTIGNETSLLTAIFMAPLNNILSHVN